MPAFGEYDSFSVFESANSKHDILGFFITNNAKILALHNPAIGGHEELAKAISKNPKYAGIIDAALAEKYDYEMAAVDSGQLVRCEYSGRKKILYLQSTPFSTKNLHSVQALFVSEGKRIDTIVVSGWRIGDTLSDPNYQVVSKREYTFDDFMIADKSFVQHGMVMLKQLPVEFKSYPASSGHKGRPGQRGGSLPANASDATPVKVDQEAQGILMANIKMMSDLHERHKPKDLMYNSWGDLIIKNGRFFTPQPLPKGIRKGTAHECYMNAYNLATRDDGYTYVEGFALISSDIPLPIEHAWVVDKAGNVIDPTWTTPGAAYFGVPLTEDFVRSTALKTRVYGVFGYDAKWLLKTGLPKDAIATFESKSFVEKQLPINEQSRANLITIRTGIFNNDSDALAEQMFTGGISLGQWEERMKTMVKELHTSTATIGKGGWENMTQSDWGRAGAEIRAQYRYLHGFAEKVATDSDTMSLKAIQARAHMYGNASKHTAVLMQAGDLSGGTKRHPTGFDKLPFLPGDGSTECLVSCRCQWVLTVVDKTKTVQLIQAVWVLADAEHCKTCIERDGYTVILKVPIDIDIPDIIGGY